MQKLVLTVLLLATTAASGRGFWKNKYNKIDKESCKYKAQTGGCQNNADYMLENCAEACQKFECANVHPKCIAFAARHMCQVDPAYMHLECRKACKHCVAGDTDVMPSVPENFELHPHYLDYNPAFVMPDENNMAPAEETTMAAAEETTMAAAEETTMAAAEETTMVAAEETTMAMVEETTMAMNDDTTMAAVEETTMAMEEGSAMAMEEGSAMAMDEETTMAAVEETEE